MGIINSARIGLKKKEIANLESERAMWSEGCWRDKEEAEEMVEKFDRVLNKSYAELSKLESKR